jgi:hypothetical protein
MESRRRLGGLSSYTWYSAHVNRPSDRPRRKAARTIASPISLKSEVNPRSSGVYSRFILAFLEQQLGDFSRSSGSIEGFNPLYHIDGPRSIWLAGLQENQSFDLQLTPALDGCQLSRTGRPIEL